jgi:flagellar basal body-associated protein FliL
VSKKIRIIVQSLLLVVILGAMYFSIAASSSEKSRQHQAQRRCHQMLPKNASSKRMNACFRRQLNKKR